MVACIVAVEAQEVIREGFIAIVAIFISTSTFAIIAGSPVYDASNYLQMVNELKSLEKQYNMLKNTYDNAIRQYKMMNNVNDGLRGQYGYGTLLDTANDALSRNWSPSTWNNALNGVAGGNPARYQELQKQYEQNHQTVTPVEYQRGSSAANTKDYQNQVAVNKTAAVQSAYAFDDIKQHLDRIHQLTQKIETTANVKASMDLNTRLIAELAYISTQELKMQTLINQQLVQQGSSQISSEIENSKFNQLS
jgi:type IV secretion system protein VirB5